MRALGIVLLGITIAGMVSCSKPTPSHSIKDDPFPMAYENELFSINLPKGWVCDSSGWKGLDSLQNVVEIFNPNGRRKSCKNVKYGLYSLKQERTGVRQCFWGLFGKFSFDSNTIIMLFLLLKTQYHLSSEP